MDLGNYLLYRNHIQTGDLLGVRGYGLVARFIRWRTKSPYSHVGMFIRDYGDWVLVLQSDARHGVYEVPAFRYLQNLHAGADWIPLDHEYIRVEHPEYRSQILGARRELGRNYDHRGVLSYIVPWIKQSTAAYYCSELVATIFKRIGLLEDIELSPGDLLKKPFLKDPVPLE